MPSLRDLRRKIASVRSTQSVTRTMRMVAAARLRRLSESLERFRPYLEAVQAMMREVMAREDPGLHRVLRPSGAPDRLLLVVTADRGLCGAFNLKVNERALRLLREEGGVLWVVGRKARDYLGRRGHAAERCWAERRAYGVEEAAEIARGILEGYLGGRFGRVDVLYTRFISPLRQEVVLEHLLPPEPPPRREPVDHLWEPSPREVLDALVEEWMRARLYGVLLESQASEQASRMNAMDNATNNCEEMISQLTLLYNKTRQATITREVVEITSGAEALKRKGR